jgi:GrpB-like predicted nucleotidyltransferase (UPF0157 family)
MDEDAKTDQLRLLHRLQKEIGDFGGEPMLKRLRRWRNVRSPEIHMAQVPYRPEWAAAFSTEAQRFRDSIGREDVQIHHFGSSAIPGLASKPILDMAIVVADADVHAPGDVEPCLRSLGYTAWGESPIAAETRWFWYARDDGMQCVAHVCSTNNPWLSSALNFRDYLSAFPEKRAVYESTKQRLAMEHDADVAIYTLRKTLLMYSMIAEANAWRERQHPGDDSPR